MTVADCVVVLLFFCGIALIAAGLWQWSSPVSLVFIGAALLYIAASISKSANSPRKDGKK